MQRFLLIVVVILTFLPPGYGCINSYSPNHKAITEGESAYERITTPIVVRSWETLRETLTERLKQSRDVETLNDLAVALMHTGAAAEAIPLLEEIERISPGLYQTATNLGTAYELLGRPKDALVWIEKGIALNPDSHNGSEWIHVAVLKAKLALEQDPHWLKTHRVLGMDFGDGPFPQAPKVLPTGTRGGRLDIPRVLDALELQLRERLQFVSPPDESVAQLLFDYASLTVIKTRVREAGFPVFRLAAGYAIDPATRDAISERLRTAPPTFWEKRWAWGFSVGFLGMVLFGSFRDVRQAAKRQQAGEVDERYVSFPPLLTILLGVVASLWISFSQRMHLSKLLFFLSVLILGILCIGAVKLFREGEKQRRIEGLSDEFSKRDFSLSTAFFITAWLAVSYVTIMNR